MSEHWQILNTAAVVFGLLGLTGGVLVWRIRRRFMGMPAILIVWNGALVAANVFIRITQQ